METNRRYEQAVDLRDLFFHLLYRWRSILAAALIGAVLLGVFQYHTIESVHREGRQTLEEKQYEIASDNYHESIDNLKHNIETYTKLMSERRTYRSNSLLMQIDTQNEWVATQRYYVTVDPEVLAQLPMGSTQDPADAAISIYTASLKSGLNSEDMIELLGTDKVEYIDEICYTWTDTDANIFSMRVLGNSEETVRKVAEYFSNRLFTVCQQNATKVVKHTLVMADENVVVKSDTELSTKQSELNQEISDYQKTLQRYRQELTTLEETPEPVKPGNHVKMYAAVGFVIGAMLLAIIYVIAYIKRGRLRVAADFTECFRLPMFGETYHTRARRSGKGIDKLIEKFDAKPIGAEKTPVFEKIAALLAEKYTGKSLLLTGTVSGKALGETVDALNAQLNGAVKLSARADFLNDKEAASAAKDADGVILVEEKHVSSMRGIGREIDVMRLMGANIEGGILI